MKVVSLLAAVISLGLVGCQSYPNNARTSSNHNIVVKVLDSKNDRLESIIKRQEFILEKRPTDERAMNTLGIAYIQKARETGDLAWYVKGRKVLEKAVMTNELSTTSLHNLAYAMTIFHEFSKAVELAERAIELDPDDAEAHGVLFDSYSELGQYDSAAQAAQRMVDLKPSLASYSRGAQIRWIMGNPKGAMYLMQKAIDAGGSHPESTAWCRTQLASMAFQTGNVLQAEQTAEAVLRDLPDYRHAQAILAKVRVSQRRFDEAIELLRKATSVAVSPSYTLDLADIYQRLGRHTLAKQEVQALIKGQMEYARYGIRGDEAVVGIALVDHGGDMDRALTLLGAEAAAHNTVAVNSAYAWALFKSGQTGEAKKYIDRAMRTNIQDALLWYRASCVEKALGNLERSRQLLARAQSLNPNFSTLHSDPLYASR